jgi:DNA (cytosine-5)-methyltransferase 1
MRYGSVCSGIEAASVAWEPLGWTAAWLAEIEPFPSAVLAHHYPDVPNLGDITDECFIDAARTVGTIDVLVGGTPCQSFSVAGLRGGLSDDRGNLALQYCRIAHALRPEFIVWENVPGVLSSNGGRDFGAILGAMAEIGYHLAYRILDAQHFGVPQRRRRVFVVGHLGDWRRAAQVLFEPQSLRGDTAPRRKTGQDVAGTLKGGSGERGYPDPSDRNGGGLIAQAFGGNNTSGPIDQATACNAHAVPHGRQDFESETFIVNARQDPVHASGSSLPLGAKDTGHAIVSILEAGKRQGTKADKRDGLGISAPGDPMFTLQSGAQHAIAFETRYVRNGRGAPSDIVPPLTASRLGKGDSNPHVCYENHAQDARIKEVAQPTLNAKARTGGNNLPLIQQGPQVRRLTPVECERLQGFPDDWTRVPWRNKPADDCLDGPRYKAIGNSMAVPVIRWIGERIAHANADR